MKMRDVFGHELVQSNREKIYADDEWTVELAEFFHGDEFAKAAAHAINCHDELVAIVERFVAFYPQGINCDLDACQREARAILNKAMEKVK